MAASYRSPKTRVRSSATHGRGLFAVRPIPKGDIVSVRGGHLLSRPQERKLRKPPGYWGYPITEELVLGPLTKGETESVMMFLNHSCDPNIGIQGQIVFVAMRDIRAGEELTIDYAMFGGISRPMRCRCAAATCRRVVRSSDWKRPALQKKYAKYFAWHVAQRIRGAT
jgi:SET domain-containing protein